MTLAIHEQLIEQNLTLLTDQLPNDDDFPGLTAAQVWQDMPANVPSVTWPGIVFTVVGVSEEYEAIDETSDAVERPVVCAIVNRTEPRYPESRPNFLLWRQSLVRLFRLQTIRSLVPEVSGVWVDTDTIIDEASIPRQYFVSGFVLRHRCVEPRGIPAQM